MTLVGHGRENEKATMDDDDGLCDLDTLVAMLDDDNDEAAAPLLKKENTQISDPTELDALATFMVDDSDFEETENSELNKFSQKPEKLCENASRKKDSEKSSSSLSGSAFVKSRNNSLCEATSRDKKPGISSIAEKSLLTSSVSPSKYKEQGLKAKIVTDTKSLDLMSPEALREEMANMQQKMTQLQKLLEQQQQFLGPKLSQEQGEKGKDGSELKRAVHGEKKFQESNSVPRETAKPKSIPVISQINKQKPMDKSSTRNLKLLSDDDDVNLFFRKTSPASKSFQEVEKTDAMSQSVKKIPNKQEMSRDLFGDSDCEELDGAEMNSLSEAGKDLQTLLHSSQKHREAHQPKYNLNDNRDDTCQSWTRAVSKVDTDTNGKKVGLGKAKEMHSKHVFQCSSSFTEQVKPASTTAVTEDFSKIRIINPLVSSSLMKMRMEGRKLINLSKIHLKLKTPDLQGNWVTIGVIVSKTDAKSSSSGKPYSIWKLNNLEDLDNSVSFFLFGEVHKQLWKTDTGTVIGLLNPSIMESMEKNNSVPAFTIKNPSQLMMMGTSKDLGWCTSVTKKGNKCNTFINKKHGECCAYHVQAAYRKMSSNRLELHGSVSGIKPKSFEKKIFSKDCAYIYGGCTYVPNSTGSSKSKKGLTLTALQAQASKGRPGKVNTLSIHNIKPQLPASGKAGKIDDPPNNIFMDMINVPSPGSMNLVAFLKNKERTGLSKSPVNGSKQTFQVVTPKDLIKQHKHLMQQKIAEKRKASDLLLNDSEYSMAKGALMVTRETDPLKRSPVLGKGFYKGEEISLDASPQFVPRMDRMKLKAISLIQQKGGVQQEDPNATKKTDTKTVSKIKRRVEDDFGKRSSSEQSSSPGNFSPSTEPPKKKSRLLGSVDLNSAEVKRILKARSKHVGAIAQAEAEREEAYFNVLEKKEMMEEKMKSITSLDIKVVTCKQCLYTAQSAKESCKQEGHTLTVSKSKKRFFMCKKCKHRTYIIGGKFPTQACRKCGAQSFEKTSMYKERNGPKLESEILSLRGDEVKYLNSMDQKVFLNAVVDTD